MISADHWYRLTNESEIPSPTLLIYLDRVAENVRRMIAGAGGVDKLRPHVKTHKLPQLVELQIEQGITKFKAATIAEAEMTASAGAKDVLLAYPLVGPNISRFARLVKHFPQTRFSTLVDHAKPLDEFRRAAHEHGVPLALLVDLNVGMNRTGIAIDEAGRLYRLLAKTPGLTPAGFHAYDGHLRDNDHAKLKGAVEKAFDPVWKLRRELETDGIPVPTIVASGTPTFPILAETSGVEVGCGTTALWDAGQEEISPDLDFLHAAVLLTRVISRPAHSKACLDLGHKAVASEMPHPRVRLLGFEDVGFVTHNEEHLVIEGAHVEELEPGDVLYAIPRHICPTVALHSEVWAVRDQSAVEPWPVTARARRITI